MRNFNTYYVKFEVDVRITGKEISSNEEFVVDANENSLEVLNSPKSESSADEKSEIVYSTGELSDNNNPKSNDDPDPGPEPPIEPGVKGKVYPAYFYMGIRLESILYSDEKIRKLVGLFAESDLKLKDKTVSKKFMRNYTDLAALGAITSYSLIFEAKRTEFNLN